LCVIGRAEGMSLQLRLLVQTARVAANGTIHVADTVERIE
jgi:hypothetical protein